MGRVEKGPFLDRGRAMILGVGELGTVDGVKFNKIDRSSANYMDSIKHVVGVVREIEPEEAYVYLRNFLESYNPKSVSD